MREVINNIYVQDVEINSIYNSRINIIIIKGEKKSLLFDAGIYGVYMESYLNTLESMLDELNIKYKELECIISHCHPNHIGLAKYLNSKDVKIYMNNKEKDYIRDYIFFALSKGENRKELFKRIGISKLDSSIYERLDSYSKELFEELEELIDFEFDEISLDEKLSYGGYCFGLVDLKGHSRAQIGLYDAEKSVMICGEHMMRDVRGIIGSISVENDALSNYLKTMESVKHVYNGSLFISSYGREFIDAAKEADKVIFSHIDRCSIIFDLLRKENGEFNITEIVLKLYSLDIEHIKIEDFTLFMLSVYQVYAYLVYMKNKDLVIMREKEGILYWSSDNK